MTRTNVEALTGPQARGTEANRRGSSRAARRLMVLPVALLLAIAPAAPTLAASSKSKEALSGYGNKPSSGTSPSKSTKTPTSSTPTTGTPAKETAPATSSSVPTTTTAPTKSSSLPFTGFDLRWTVGGGLMLVAMGFSIVTMQRRQRGRAVAGRDAGR
jgi:hypothetical protein